MCSPNWLLRVKGTDLPPRVMWSSFVAAALVLVGAATPALGWAPPLRSSPLQGTAMLRRRPASTTTHNMYGRGQAPPLKMGLVAPHDVATATTRFYTFLVMGNGEQR